MPNNSKTALSILPTVVIIGRTNVGKSFLFNRLTETGKALISREPNTTRDYNLGQVSWRNRTFSLIDTGGVNIAELKHSIDSLLAKKPKKSPGDGATIEAEIIKQTKNAVKKADLLLLVVDGQAGLMPEDRQLALVVKKLSAKGAMPASGGKLPVMLVVNKIDNQRLAGELNEFFKLGLGLPAAVSAANGSGTGDLLDIMIKKLKWPRGRTKKAAAEKSIRVAIIGKPNVGKSSLLNKILGEQRVIVSAVPHTTREPQDTEITYQDRKITLIDTAGLAKKAKIQPGLDKISSRRSLNIIKSADIILFVTEADKPLTSQDSRLAGLIKDSRAGIIIVCNKWDLIDERTEKLDAAVKKYYLGHFPYLSFAPLIFVSALTGRGTDKILELAVSVAEERSKEIPGSELKAFIRKLTKMHYPAAAEGEVKPVIHDFRQTKTNPPQFTATVGPRQSLHFSYLRYIENQLRAEYGFFGTPIGIHVETMKR